MKTAIVATFLNIIIMIVGYLLGTVSVPKWSAFVVGMAGTFMCAAAIEFCREEQK